MPKQTLTLVRKLIERLETLSDDEFDEFMDVIETSQVSGIEERERREALGISRPELRLIVSEMED